MGYRIAYQPEHGNTHGIGRAAICGLFFLLFLFSVDMFWEEGRAALLRILFNGDLAAAAAASEGFVRQLENGIDTKDAVMVFCRKILEASSGAY